MNKNTEPLIIERSVKAPVEKVWNAITDKNEMKHWYFNLPDFKPEEGFEFEFTGGPEDGVQYEHQCKITEVVPLKKITYSWKYKGYEGISYVTFELSSEGENTKIKLTHRDLHTFPDNPDFVRKNFEAGWNDIIGKFLVDYVVK